MVKKMRIVIHQGLLDYATVKGMEQPKIIAKESHLNLLSKLWRSVM